MDVNFDNFPFVYPPLDHQIDEWKVREDRARGLLWEPGTGKSKTAIDKMVYLWLTGKIDTVIIMAKKGEYTNWKYTELPEHMPNGHAKKKDENDNWYDIPFPDTVPVEFQTISYLCEVYRSGMNAWEKHCMREMVKCTDKLRILNINIESMTFEGGQLARAFAKSRKKGLFFILDESTAAKSHKSARSKEVYKIATFANYRMIMTGTSLAHSPLDIWGQSMVLGNGILGTTSFYAFKGTYAVEETQYFGTRNFKKIVGFRDLDKLQAKIKTFASIKTRDECFDLPPKIYKKIDVQLSDEQQSMYSDMRDLALAEFGDGTIVESSNALELLSKLDQIACGQLKLEDGTFRILDNNRISTLMSLLEVSEARGIIWCNYRGLLQHTFTEIQKTFGIDSVARYYGGVNDAEREKAVHDFQNPRSNLRWIVANQQSLGYGRTLIAGTENFYLSNSYNLEHRLQSEDRTMRLGQNRSVLYNDFYSRGTVNEKIYVNLRNKKNVMSEVLGTPIGLWL